MFIVFTICFLGVFTVSMNSKAKGRMDIKFSIYDDFSITNDKGKKFTYHQFYNLGGNMKIYEKHMHSSEIRLEVDDSSRFTYKPSSKQGDIRLANDKRYVALDSKNVQSALISYMTNSSKIETRGKNTDIMVTVDAIENTDYLVTVCGKGNDIKIENRNKKLIVKNMKDVCKILSGSVENNKDREIRFFPTSSKVTIRNFTGKNIKVKGAIVLNSDVSKKVEKLCAIPVSPNKMLVNFNRVKGADGYYVYRYDEVSNNYKKIEELEGNSSTVFQDKNVQKDKVYHYKVSSYKKKKGKKKESKMSYEVSAITSSKKFGNATKVTLNKSGKRKLKKGKSLKLKAKIIGEKGKKLVSKDIRWCSKNKKVAVVDKQGRVTALKKGICKIHAKAHNGKNSKAIVIKVV